MATKPNETSDASQRAPETSDAPDATRNGKGTWRYAPPRDERGRILKGYSLNPEGRKPLAAELPFIEGVKKGASAEMVAKLIEMIGKYALEKKSLQAAALYLQYTVPPPAKTVITGQAESLSEVDDAQIRAILEDAQGKRGDDDGDRSAA